ncbi:unnamed protein product [Sphagnum jensenii]|uniref:Protein kinase domain-containing protein n=1 Tax=Sphagnum jensenii TaxID=128206 RepID=A0ABP1BYT7_9BRYO
MRFRKKGSKGKYDWGLQIEVTIMLKAWSMFMLMTTFDMFWEVQGGQPEAANMTPDNLSSDLCAVQMPMASAGMQTEFSKLAKLVMAIDMFRTIVSITVIFIVGLSTGFWWQMSKKVEPPPPQQQQPLQELNAATSSPREQQVGSLEMFTLQEILTMTDFFKVVLGKGGQGTVYEATLPGPEPQQKAAVKKLDRNKALDGVRTNSGEEMKNQDSIEKEFWSELRSISRLHHNNLVSLLGYCIEANQLFLIYEFMENGSLQQHLHNKKNEETDSGHLFDWHQRMKVAVDVAQGLEYLHNYAKPTLVHRDIKPSNILFDADMHAKIADFGLSKTQNMDPSTSMRLKGTPGYVDPDYYKTGQANEKNDVYSYGVVLLELVTGKKAIERQTSLVDWCREFLHSDPELWPLLMPKMVDDRINPGEYLPQQLLAVVQLAMACVDDEPERRPSMREVVKRLYIADCEDASSSEISNEDSLSNHGGLSNRTSGSPQASTYTRTSSDNGWSTYVITQTSVVIKCTIENKKLAIRCKIWPTMQNLGLNKIEATLDDALMWKKGLWFYNASSSREFSVDEVKLRAEWQVGLRFSRHLLKPGDPRRHQGPFCVEYLALKDAQGEPLIEYHGDRSPRYPLNRESSVEPPATTPMHRRRSSIMRDSSFRKKTRKSLANLAPR